LSPSGGGKGEEKIVIARHPSDAVAILFFSLFTLYVLKNEGIRRTVEWYKNK
jgi:hypothetical protein